jgi:hypothetical protein
MSTKSREVIWGGTIMGAKMRARHAREAAQKAAREADRAEAYAWSVQMEGRPRDTPIWKLEAALKCRSCRKGRYAPPVHMIKLTATQEITPYKWVHPDDDDRR